MRISGSMCLSTMRVRVTQTNNRVRVTKTNNRVTGTGLRKPTIWLGLGLGLRKTNKRVRVGVGVRKTNDRVRNFSTAMILKLLVFLYT